jgi:hypothetical protein
MSMINVIAANRAQLSETDSSYTENTWDVKIVCEVFELGSALGRDLGGEEEKRGGELQRVDSGRENGGGYPLTAPNTRREKSWLESWRLSGRSRIRRARVTRGTGAYQVKSWCSSAVGSVPCPEKERWWNMPTLKTTG